MQLSAGQQKHITFHLGLEKTGSTFYQHTVFKNLRGLTYHRKSRYKYFPEIILADPESRHLFTFETDHHFVFNVDKVASQLPHANVFLILRRQDSWLSSKYNYHIRKHGYLSLREFFDLEKDEGFFKQESFYMRPKIEYLESKMKGRLLFLNYSELKEDPEKYVGRMLSFLDATLSPKANIYKARKPAFSLKQNRILKRFNKLYPYTRATTSSRFVNKVHYKYREFLLHTVAFLARFVPQAWVSQEPLIDQAYLDEVREFYQEDWAYALSRVNQVIEPRPERKEEA